MELDKEVAGTTTYDYGFRIYNPGLGRFLIVDPLMKKYPGLTPYQFAGNKPTIAIDLDGLEEYITTDKWLGVTYRYREFDVGGGLGYGLNYTHQSGFAYAEVGKTKFTMKLTIVADKQIQDAINRKRTNFIAGASITYTWNVKQDWKHETFLKAVGAINVDIGIPTSVPKFNAKNLKLSSLVAVNLGVSSEGALTVGGGFGVGIKIPVTNVELEHSISITDEEPKIVKKKAGTWTQSGANWFVKPDANPSMDEKGQAILFSGILYTRNKKGEEVSTGISMISGVKTGSDNPSKVQSDNVWRSIEYQSHAVDAERYGGTRKEKN